MPAPTIKEILEHHFEIIGKTEYNGHHYLLVSYKGSTPHRLLSIHTERDLDAQLGAKPGSLKILLQQADNPPSYELFRTLQDLHRKAPRVDPTEKAIEAHRILSRLHDLQAAKTGASSRRRTEIEHDYNRLSNALRAVDAKSD